MRVLVVEDDKQLAAALRRGLEEEGYAVDTALDGEEGEWLARENSYDALVLDVMLPRLRGDELCSRRRDAGDWTPILMLTARSGPEQEAQALDAGADDFLAKPFSFVVLLARLRALVRRGAGERPAVLEVGDLRLDPAAHRVTRGDTEVELTPRQFSMLEFLMRRSGEVVSKATILDHVWDFAFEGDPNIVEVYARQLRQRIDLPFGRTSLQTVRLVGYRLVADVKLAGLSLRTGAAAVATLLCAAVMVGGSVLLVTTLDRHLTASSDDLSRSRVRDLLDQAAGGSLPPVLRNVNDDAVAQVVAADGTVLAASPNIEGRGPIVSPHGPADGVRRTIRAPDDSETETYRVWVQSGPGPGGDVTVVEGSSLESVHEATTTLRRTLLVGVPLVVAALGLVMWLVLGRALARLDRIRAEVDAIGPDQLERRLPEDGRHDEVGRLATTMNRMLARLDGSAQRQRRLVADVSHDLQGPLAAQRVSLELALAAPAGVDADVLRDDVLGATGEMERLVDDLLVLAAADEGAPAAESAVDLDAIVLEEAARARNARPRVIDTAQVSAGPVRANPSELRRVVRNLLDNAVTHAGSRVELRLRSTDGHVVLDIVDDGPGVPEDERERVFERFHRGDPARTRGAPGSGLGLAIARSLAERAGGRLELVDGGPGANFRLTLPLLSAG